MLVFVIVLMVDTWVQHAYDRIVSAPITRYVVLYSRMIRLNPLWCLEALEGTPLRFPASILLG